MHKDVRDVSFLLDTGASVSILSKEVFDEIPVEDRPSLRPSQFQLTTSNGSNMHINGVARLSIEIQGMPLEEDFWICDSDNTGILGILFMERASVVLDVGRKRVFIRNQSVRLHDQFGKPLQSKVVANQTVHIPPNREVIPPGKVCAGRHRDPGIVTLDPAMKVSRETGALVARVVVNANESTIPVRVFNPTDETITIHKFAVMGVLTPVLETKVLKATGPFIGKVSASTEKATPSGVPEHLQDLFERSRDGLTDLEVDELRKLLNEYADVFSKGDDDIGRTDWVKHDIDTGNERPVQQKPRRLPLAQQDLRDIVGDLKTKGFISDTNSPWASNVILVKKKDKNWRLCVDYRAVNAKTAIKDPYMLPRIDDTLDALSGSQYYCTLDMASSYHQCELTDEAKARSAFITSFGHYQWEVMPFGLMNSPGTFQRLMNRVLQDSFRHCSLLPR